jgi:polysaccharide biosynthesis/export protein
LRGFAPANKASRATLSMTIVYTRPSPRIAPDDGRYRMTIKMRTASTLLFMAALAAGTVARGGDELLASAKSSRAPSPAGSVVSSAAEYHVQPGDMLTVSVWKETDLTLDVLVRPDGGLSFPLVGDVASTGKSIAALREEFTERLKRYIPNPVVTVAAKTINGNRIFVLGKVQKPGEYPFGQAVDVMQALSLAGGTTPFAALNDIVILHRDNGQLRAIPFHYGEVEHGKGLAQNILLQSGDTVVVP